MSSGVPGVPGSELDLFVDALEAAHGDGRDADPADFLPDPGHPLYQAVLVELIRVDLEFHWRRGRPKRLEEYRARFPGVFADRNTLLDLAFEEYRLRRQAGEAPPASEYRERFDLSIGLWQKLQPLPEGSALPVPGPTESPPSDAFPATVALTVNPVVQAARSYQRFRNTDAGAAPGRSDVEAWCSSFKGNNAYAPLFRDVHRADPHAALRLADAAVRMPEPGADFLGFRLVAELGRGAFARVFLARQGDLANRFVALKVAPNVFGEAQTLAQLQHTNIVPIYSTHQAGPLQAVCMPYFGATTLAHVLRSFGKRGSVPASGKDLVTVLQHHPDSLTCTPPTSVAWPMTLPETLPRKEPAPPPGAPEFGEQRFAMATKVLEGLTYVQAVLWLGSRLAEGLGHAHERGILHRDLKPANVLLTDEGQPMLLDFNLSEDTKEDLGASAAAMGGTLPYMAPEHLEAFRGGPRRVDARSDLYALGLILYELLTARAAFEMPSGPLPKVLPRMIEERQTRPVEVRRWNPAASPAVEAIIRRCLHPDPPRRYQSARELQEDLDRQREDRPLRYAPEPSVRERVRKWIRRHPRLASSSSVAAAALAVVALLATAAVVRGQRLAGLQALDTLSHFRDDLKAAQVLLLSRDAETEHLEKGMARCRQALNRYQALDRSEWWDLPEVRRLPATEREQLRDDIGELFFLSARVALLRAEPQAAEKRPEELNRALHWNELAETSYHGDRVPRAVWQQRTDLYAALGQSADAERLSRQAISADETARDYYLSGHVLIGKGKFRDALPLLERSVRLDPQGFSAWMVLGNCYDGLMRNADAAACYGTCMALRPDFGWAWFNRGLAYYRQGRYEQARADFARAIELDPDNAEFFLNRALAGDRMGRYPEALADLDRVMELGTERTQVYFIRADIREKDKDRDGARRDREEGLRRRPTDESSWVSRGMARLPADADGALADFDEALKLNSYSFYAMQNKAHVYADFKHDDRAVVKVLDRAVALYPDNVLPRAGRGVSLARLGERDAALADAREALLLDTGPANLYQVACIYALTSRKNGDDRLEALHLLSRALKGGFGLEYVDQDSDLDPIRNEPEFRRVISLLNANGATAAWQQTILRAVQTWAVNANINVSVVADGGQPFGATGAIEGDSRFGDIRIGAEPLPAGTIATGDPFNWSGTTWAGDIILNSNLNFGLNGTGQYDLYTAVLHEAGHVFGLDDNTDTTASAMYAYYRGPRTGLGGSDVADIQALYGARMPDACDAQKANDTPSSATALSNSGGSPSAYGDITTLADVDYYKFTTPLTLGMTSFQVVVQTSRLSSLVPTATVYNAFGTVIGSATATNPMYGDILVQVNNPMPLTTYYVRVGHATNDVFGIGSYHLGVHYQYGNVLTGTLGGLLTSPFSFVTDLTNDTLGTAKLLNPAWQNQHDARFQYIYTANLSSASDVDYYKLVAPATANNAPQTMVAMVWAMDATNPLAPRVSVFDAAQNPVPVEILANGNGTYTVQISAAASNSTYYVKVYPLNPGGSNTTGNYFLGVNFHSSPPATLTNLTASTLAKGSFTDSGTLAVTQAELLNLRLTADNGNSSVQETLTMTIVNSQGQVVATLTATTGMPPVTAVLYLQPDTYTVHYQVSYSGPTIPPALAYWLDMSVLSDPLGAYQPPPPPPSSTAPGGQPPPNNNSSTAMAPSSTWYQSSGSSTAPGGQPPSQPYHY